MKIPTACIALLCAVPVAAAEESAPPLDALGFAKALDACTVATHESPHPFVRGFTIQHRIVAATTAGCEYTQSMPGGMHMTCLLSEAGRAGLADEMRRQADGKLSGSTSRSPAWSAECEIVTKDGKRMPMKGG